MTSEQLPASTVQQYVRTTLHNTDPYVRNAFASSVEPFELGLITLTSAKNLYFDPVFLSMMIITGSGELNLGCSTSAFVMEMIVRGKLTFGPWYITSSYFGVRLRLASVGSPRCTPSGFTIT
ncbi:hypothetical protein M758_8G185300 [Ceratodon purpureus]|nr:hypothetical protein M758_8G185300 [Ceratodon purpureus]